MDGGHISAKHLTMEVGYIFFNRVDFDDSNELTIADSIIFVDPTSINSSNCFYVDCVYCVYFYAICIAVLLLSHRRLKLFSQYLVWKIYSMKNLALMSGGRIYPTLFHDGQVADICPDIICRPNIPLYGFSPLDIRNIKEYGFWLL